MSDERKSWAVKDEAIHGELVTLMDLSLEEAAALAGLQDAAKAMAGELTKVFYARLTAHENTREYFEGVDLSRMHALTGEWFTELFSGRYDVTYVKRRLKIGMVHVRIGLPVRYPLAMIDLITEYGHKVAAGSAKNGVAETAFRKVLALDVAIFNQAYEDNQLKHLAELVGGERLARRLLAGIV